MNIKKLLIGSFVLGAGLAVSRLVFARSTSEKPASRGVSYDVIDAYIEEQMRRGMGCPAHRFDPAIAT